MTTTPAASARRTRVGTAKPPSRAAAKRTEPAKAAPDQAQAQAQAHDRHTVTVTIPLDRVASVAGKVVTLPITAAQRVLPAAGGLPLYLGLGALGAAGILEWPVAAGIGIGYAVLRRGGPLRPASSDGDAAAGSSGSSGSAA